ncbi:MAG: Threonine dehydrogenase and related Zn-dependent dehydrogenase [Chthonomonadaceae bacterium]|nr:Threonine dehydrogenase and related Zn-dependent dehydrogenase [Chthonomonadaceae bacterium]
MAGALMRSESVSRAAVLPAPGLPPEIRTYAVPELEPGAVLLRTIASEVCGTDVHLQHGRLAGVPYPLIPGHVSVGEVEAVNGTVIDVEGSPIRSGDVVTFLDVHGTCGNCWYCLVAKATTRCPHRRVYGITYGANDSPGLSGGWSEKIYLRPGTKIIRLEPGVSPDTWIGGGCGLPTAVHAVELAQIRLGDRVLVQGSGPVGLSCAALAMLSGAGWVGTIGAPENRLQAAKRMGADWTIDVTTTTPDDRRRAVRDATGGRGPDIVIEASGNPQAVLEGCELVRDAGRYIVVGQYTDNGTIELNPHLHINKKHLEVRGCWGSDFSHVYRAMQVAARFAGREQWSSLISRRYSLEEVGQALADVAAGRVVKAVVVPN